MGNTLYESFNKLKKSYYNIDVSANELFAADDLHVKCEEFIENHFILGSKANAIEVSYREKYKEKGKHIHTVSLYSLGAVLENMFFSRIQNDLKNKGIDNGWYSEKEYKYTWFLTALYHDIASCVENLNSEEVPCCRNCPFKRRTTFLNSKTGRFGEELVKNYCRYRVASGKQDHGIFAGMMFYNKLFNNFHNRTKNHDWNREPVFEMNGVKWRREHLDHFAYVADAIICHNIWTVQENDDAGVDTYKKYNLEELIISNENKKLSVQEYPLHFMLCLLDTIEPVKRFTKMSAYDVLNNISVEKHSENGIRIAWNDRIKQETDFWTWIKNITGMKDWMKLDISPCKQEGDWCYVTVDFR